MGIKEGLMLADYFMYGKRRSEAELEKAKMFTAKAKGEQAKLALEFQQVQDMLQMGQQARGVFGGGSPLQSAFTQPQEPAPASQGLAPPPVHQGLDVPQGDVSQGGPGTAWVGPPTGGQGTLAEPYTMPGVEVTATPEKPQTPTQPRQARPAPDVDAQLQFLQGQYLPALIGSGKHSEALQLYKYVQEYGSLRQAASLYGLLAQNAQQLSPEQRQLVLGGIAQTMTQAGKIDDATKVLEPYMPMSNRDMFKTLGNEMQAQLISAQQAISGEPQVTPQSVGQAQGQIQQRRVDVARATGAVAAETAGRSTTERAKAEETYQRGQPLLRADKEADRYYSKVDGSRLSQAMPYDQVLGEIQTDRATKVTGDKEAQQMATIRQLVPKLNQMSRDLETIYAPGGPLASVDKDGRLVTAGKAAVARYKQSSPEYQRFLRTVRASVEQMQKVMGGAVGTQTEGDIDRGLKRFPEVEGLPDRPEVAFNAMRGIYDDIEGAMRTILDAPGLNNPEMQRPVMPTGPKTTVSTGQSGASSTTSGPIRVEPETSRQKRIRELEEQKALSQGRR